MRGTEQSLLVRQKADRLLTDLTAVMRHLNEGQEVTKHHLVALHSDTFELLRELGGLDELLERHKL